MNKEQVTERITEIDTELAKHKADSSRIGKLMQDLYDERERLIEKKKWFDAQPRVSDHAVIRYLERKHGFSFEDYGKQEWEKYLSLQQRLDQAIKSGGKELEDAYEALRTSERLQERIEHLKQKIQESIEQQAEKLETKRKQEIEDEEILTMLGVI